MFLILRQTDGTERESEREKDQCTWGYTMDRICFWIGSGQGHHSTVLWSFNTENKNERKNVVNSGHSRNKLESVQTND